MRYRMRYRVDRNKVSIPKMPVKIVHAHANIIPVSAILSFHRNEMINNMMTNKDFLDDTKRTLAAKIAQALFDENLVTYYLNTYDEIGSCDIKAIVSVVKEDRI